MILRTVNIVVFLPIVFYNHDIKTSIPFFIRYQYQIEVRNITKKISDLNEKLDMSTTLSEPRENAFIRFEYKHNNATRDLQV